MGENYSKNNIFCEFSTLKLSFLGSSSILKVLVFAKTKWLKTSYHRSSFAYFTENVRPWHHRSVSDHTICDNDDPGFGWQHVADLHRVLLKTWSDAAMKKLLVEDNQP